MGESSSVYYRKCIYTVKLGVPRKLVFFGKACNSLTLRYNVAHGTPQDCRKSLCEQLITYLNEHPERQHIAKRVLYFVSSTPTCFERSHSAGHITGSGWLLNPTGDRFLLTLHHKLQLWVQPGGHADGDPDILRVAIREAEEESGIHGIIALSPKIYDIDIHRIPGRPTTGEAEHLHYDIRYLLQAPNEQFSISDESDALGWFTPEDLTHLAPAADEAILRLSALRIHAAIPS